MEKTCPECGDKIIGRADKKFCSDACRNMHNYKQNNDTLNLVRRINTILQKNRRILIELNPKGKNKIKKNLLSEKGFNFKYFTSIYETKTGNTYYFCYEQGYLILEDEFVALVVNQDYMKK